MRAQLDTNAIKRRIEEVREKWLSVDDVSTIVLEKHITTVLKGEFSCIVTKVIINQFERKGDNIFFISVRCKTPTGEDKLISLQKTLENAPV